jgi:hypothetical protein
MLISSNVYINIILCNAINEDIKGYDVGVDTHFWLIIRQNLVISSRRSFVTTHQMKVEISSAS